MRKTDADIDRGGVQKATGADCTTGNDLDAVSNRRYTVARDEPLDIAIVYAVAAEQGVDPTALDRPLNDTVDADALRRLFASADEGLRATILVDGYEVTIADGGDELFVSEL